MLAMSIEAEVLLCSLAPVPLMLRSKTKLHHCFKMVILSQKMTCILIFFLTNSHFLTPASFSYISCYHPSNFSHKFPILVFHWVSIIFKNGKKGRTTWFRSVYCLVFWMISLWGIIDLFALELVSMNVFVWFWSAWTYNVFLAQGSYSLKMKMYDSSNRELTCIGFDFSIGFALSVADS